MTTGRSSPFPPKATELEAYLAGELSPERAREIEMASEQDPDLRGWLADRRTDHQAFLLDPRRRSFPSLVAEAGEGKRRRRWIGLGFGLALAVTAGALVVPRTAERSSGLRTKGALSVRTAVLEGGRSHLLGSGEALHPGARLRLTVEDALGGFVTVLLEEEAGDVSVLYHPRELGELSPGSHVLPGSLELDDRLGRERLYVILSDDAPEVERWLSELERSRRRAGFGHGWLPPGGSRVKMIEYDKVEGR